MSRLTDHWIMAADLAPSYLVSEVILNISILRERPARGKIDIFIQREMR
jgi:hypothetical protein